MKLVQKYKIIFYFLLSFLILNACNRQNSIKNKNVDLKVIRFDKELSQLDELHYNQQLDELLKKYPLLMEVYVEQIARAGAVSDTLFKNRLKPVIFDNYTQKLYEKVETTFPDFEPLKKEINEALNYIVSYFPDIELPEVYTIVSNFGLSTATYENILLISLDMYLGSNYQYYEGLFPKYKYNYFTTEQLVPDVARVWFSYMFPEDSFAGKTLLSKMIYFGKMNLFLEKMIPGISDTILLQYTNEQIKFADKYRKELWQSIVESKMLFNSDMLKTGRYIEEAPFTNAYNIPQQCPPRIGRYFGWQIVKNYHRKNPDINLADLMNEKDENLILRGYKP